MLSPRKGSSGRRWTLWAGLVVGGLLPSVGCQVEYAGMTLPSGKYMRDDVQYFPPGPDFPWANTQAATQRARMTAMGIAPEAAAPLPGQPGQPALAPAAGTPGLGAQEIAPQPPAPGAVPRGPGVTTPGEADPTQPPDAEVPAPPNPGAPAPAPEEPMAAPEEAEAPNP